MDLLSLYLKELNREMDLLSLYLKEFNWEYLSSPEDRRRFWENLVNFMATLTLLIISAVILWVL